MAPNLSKPSGLKDPATLRAYSALKTVVEMDPTLKDKVRIPTMAITGIQSAGKTSFIESMVGFPVGYTDRLTGTRCPVRYILRNASEPSWKVGGKTLKQSEDVREKVTDHMKKLGAKNEFSEEALKVEICGPDLLDLDITDLPGLQDRNEPAADQIAAINAKYFADSAVIPVALCKAEKSQQTQLDLAALRDIGFDERRGMIVVNYFNKQIGDLHTASHLNEYCEGYFQKFRDPHFMMLHYQEGINKDGMTFSELQDFYSKLPENENRAFEKKILEVEAAEEGVEVKEEVKKSLGITSALQRMQLTLSAWMDGNRQAIVSTLEERRWTLSERSRTLQESSREQQPERLMAVWNDYISEWNKVMNGVYQAKHTYVKSQPKKTSQFAKTFDWGFDAGDPSLVRTFEEEWNLLPEQLKKKVDFFPDIDELREQLRGTHLVEQLDARLNPHAAFHRLLMVCAYVIMIYPLRPLTADEVYSKNGYCSDGMSGRFNKHTVVKDMITERLFEIQDIMEVTLSHIQKVYEAPVERVHELLAERHPVVANHSGFQREMSNVYRKLLEEQLLKANFSLQELIKMQTSCVSVDLPTRMISLLGMTPLRQDVLKPTADNFENEMDDKARKPDDESAHPESIQWLTTNNVAERKSDGKVPDRVTKHRAALLGVKKVLHQAKNDFKYIDFVEGGCQDFAPEERRSINVAELNKEAEQYFVLLKGLIVLDIERSLNFHVYDFLSGHLLDGMEMQMRKTIHKIMIEDEGKNIEQMVGGQEILKKQMKETEEQLASVEEALQHLGELVEPQPASKGRSHPLLVGEKAVALPCRAKPFLLRGVLERPFKDASWDLAKMPSKWATPFCRQAEEDIANHIKLNKAKVKVTIDGPHLRYEVETQSQEQFRDAKQKIEGRLVLPQSEAIYRKSLHIQGSGRTREGQSGASNSMSQSSPRVASQDEEQACPRSYLRAFGSGR